MAVHTVTEAAKLAGVTRRTIYRYIKQGKLSTVVTGSDSAQIETSELLRVFGNLSHPEESKVSTGSHQKEPEMSQIRDLVQGQQQLLLEDKLETQKLREQVTGLQNERDSVAQELDKVKAELEAERGKGFWKRLFRQG